MYSCTRWSRVSRGISFLWLLAWMLLLLLHFFVVVSVFHVSARRSFVFLLGEWNPVESIWPGGRGRVRRAMLYGLTPIVIA